MLKRALLCLPLLLAAMAHGALSIGDKAPDLKVSSYVKGSQVDLSKGVHVVEFWATWCGPCKQSIPHLTEMSKKFAGKADFTGVSVWENGNDQIGQVTKFVESMGEKMDYNVAFDGDAKFMTDNWMKAANQNGIPAAFLVKDGTILWIGHPMDGLDKVVSSVIDGTFDMAAEKARQEKAAAQQAEFMKVQQKRNELLKPYSDAVVKKDTEGALKALDAMVKKDATLTPTADMLRFNLLVPKGDKRGYQAAERLANGVYKSSPQGLNQLAWTILDPEKPVTNPNYKVAEKLAAQALKAAGGSDPMIMDTYALALFRVGKKAEALALEQKAMEILKKDPAMSEQFSKEFQSRLDLFQKG